VEKTVNGNTVNYVYDGAQAIAEVTGGTVSAAILTGLNLDEVLARYAASGNRTYLTDALNTVIAQANDTQAIENYYTYTPYGETQTLGPDGGNPIQYTARENDQTGLYYYRARYYDPVLKRFVSEDPIGIAGGLNLYGYVGGDPLSFVDPLGNRAELISIVIIAASIAIYTDAANILINLITPVQNRIDGLNKADQFAPPGAQGSADFDPKTGVPYGILEQRRSHEEVKNFKRDFFDIGKGATELISPSPASLIKDIAKICR
jgi:RHS repeat-associated protein